MVMPLLLVHQVYIKATSQDILAVSQHTLGASQDIMVGILVASPITILAVATPAVAILLVASPMGVTWVAILEAATT